MIWLAIIVTLIGMLIVYRRQLVVQLLGLSVHVEMWYVRRKADAARASIASIFDVGRAKYAIAEPGSFIITDFYNHLAAHNLVSSAQIFAPQALEVAKSVHIRFQEPLDALSVKITRDGTAVLTNADIVGPQSTCFFAL